METVHRLSRTDARRLAVRAQLLTADRPTDLFEVVDRLTQLQLEPTSAVAPSADVVLWSRLGSGYDPQDLRDAIDEQRLVELNLMLRPAQDLVLYRAEMADWPGTGPLAEWQEEQREWVDDNNGCRLDVLERLRADGPLPKSDLPDTCVRPWRSSGWNNHRNLTMLLNLMVQRGEIAAAGGAGRDRLWDLASRVYPDDPAVPSEQAARRRAQRRLASLGIARSKGPASPAESQDVGEAGEAAVVDGVRGTWRVDPEQLAQPFQGRAALLSPLDRLIFDRKRMADLFAFDYQLEMYKPVAARRWGYWAMPVLFGDRLVGKLDARSDREERVFRVAALHRDVEFTAEMDAAVDAEIASLAEWLGLELRRDD